MSELSAMKTTFRRSTLRPFLTVVLPLLLIGLLPGLAAAGTLPPVLDLNGDAPGADYSAP